MKTSDFYYDLPPELIASEPLKDRTASRLMCVNQAGEIQHKHFYDLPNLLQPGDLLVFNNSKVIPARLYGQKPTGGKVEILIERILDDHTALAHVRGGKSLKPGSQINLLSSRTNGVDFCTIGTRQNDLFELKTDVPWNKILNTYGHIPLPPYMEREDREDDRERYQTVYAKHEGSVAAPTAGLHFTDNLLKKLQEKGIETAYVTLHVGTGTFQPVRTENISDHKMHTERFEISQETIDAIRQTKASRGRVIAVGTTSVRVLESIWDERMSGASDERKQNHHPLICSSAHLSGETNIFITPGYDFKVIDGLITNFHLPESTLLMLVSALMGKENILNVYQDAIAEKYRFFSYGDAMLLT